MNSRIASARSGFTLIEMAITVAIVAVLSSALLPLAQLAVKRVKEQELRTALRQIRTAIDDYKRAADQGRIVHDLTESGYPKSLAELAGGMPDLKTPDKKMIYFLRRLPRDPMNDDHDLSAEDSWGKRSYESPPDDPHEGKDVFDVYSRSSGVGIDGTPYSTW